MEPDAISPLPLIETRFPKAFGASSLMHRYQAARDASRSSSRQELLPARAIVMTVRFAYSRGIRRPSVSAEQINRIPSRSLVHAHAGV